jgi:hypothetical protein
MLLQFVRVLFSSASVEDGRVFGVVRFSSLFSLSTAILLFSSASVEDGCVLGVVRFSSLFSLSIGILLLAFEECAGFSERPVQSLGRLWLWLESAHSLSSQRQFE